MRIFTLGFAVWLSIIAAAVWLFFSVLEIVKYQGSIEATTLLIGAAVLGAVLIILFGLFIRWVIERAIEIHDRAHNNSER